MNRQELEDELFRLGDHWPAPSLRDQVLATISRTPASPAKRPRTRMAQWVWLATAASLVLATLPFGLTLFAPRTLQAQVIEALKSVAFARVAVSTLDAEGVRREAHLWYSRERGFRLETPQETTVDDGKRQWTWRKVGDGDESIVSRRASPGTSAMISEMFQLGDAPADWRRQRAKQHDREIAGRPCEAFIVEPPPPMVLSQDGSALVPDPHPPRLIVLGDPDERIVRIEEQRQLDGAWQAGRAISIEYDVDVPVEKFTADFPAKARVIDANAALAERFPLERALATAEAGGLLFAVHEALRGEDDTWYVVSSVRGTPEYLKLHPPQRRRLNLQTVILDVAGQPASPGIDSGTMHRAVMASAEMDGVHYLWWLAVRRRQFTVENGVRKPFEHASPSLETEPGRLSLTLTANYRGEQASQRPPRVAVTVLLQSPNATRSFLELAARVRRDAVEIRNSAGAVIGLLGGMQGNRVQNLDLDHVTDEAIVAAMTSQIRGLRDYDEVKPFDAKAPSGPPTAN